VTSFSQHSIEPSDVGSSANPADNLPLPGASSLSPSMPPTGDGEPTVISGQASLHATPPRDSIIRILKGSVLPGDRLDQFELLEYIGGGGMGRVYRARDTQLDRIVALKVLSPEQAADPDTLTRFQNEAESAARLDHEHVARVYHRGEDQGLHYIVFEYIAGVNVRVLIQANGPLPMGDAVSCTLQVAEALAHAWSREVVHRDIKPSNILITPEGKAKLIDMGLARMQRLDGDIADLTASGVTLGTFDYISPEQARDPRTADVRSDIYSLGCTCFYMLTGRPPFPEGTVLQKLLQHQGDEPPDVRQFRPEVPDSLIAVLRKMLAKDPRNRYADPVGLVEELKNVAYELGLRPIGASGAIWGVPTPPRVSPWARDLPWLTPVAALLCVVAGLHVLGDSADPPPPMLGGPEVLVPELPAPDPYWPMGDPIDDFPAEPSHSGDDSRSIPEAPPPDNLDSTAPGDTARRHQNATATGVAERNDSSSGDERQRTPPPGEGDATDEAGGRTAIAAGSEPSAGGEAAPSQDAGSLATTPTLTGPSSTEGGDSRAAPVPPDVAAPTIDLSVTPAGVLVVADGDGPGDRQFTSLASALGAAESGDVIELRYSGRRTQQPIKLENRRLTIRAGEGFRPVLVFEPSGGDPVEQPRSMVALTGGSLTCIELAIELNVPTDVAAEYWSLLELRDGARVRIQRGSVTVRNVASDGTEPYHPNVAVVRASAMPGADRVTVGESDVEVEPISVALFDTCVRGEADLLRLGDAGPIDLTWQNGLLDVAGRMVTLVNARTVREGNHAVELELAHLTINTGEGLVDMSAESPRGAGVPVELALSNSIVIGHRGMPLLVQRATAGDGAGDAARRRVVLRGDRNFYESVDTFWRILPAAGDEESIEMDFRQWRLHWGNEDENLPSLDRVAWESLPGPDQPRHRRRVSSYRLSDAENPAIGASSDGQNAGMIPARLPAYPGPSSTEY